MPGFISEEIFPAPEGDGRTLSVSYWRDVDAIRNWRNDPEHQVAIERGKREFFSWYRITVLDFVRQYDFDLSRPDDDRQRYANAATLEAVAERPLSAELVDVTEVARGMRVARRGWWRSSLT